MDHNKQIFVVQPWDTCDVNSIHYGGNLDSDWFYARAGRCYCVNQRYLSRNVTLEPILC